MKLIITIIFFLILFGIVETVQRLTGIKPDFTRKITHVLSGVTIFFLPYFLNVQDIIILSLVFTILLIISKNLGLLISLHKISRKTLGEVFYPLGVGVAAFFFLPLDVQVFQFGILVLALADASAGVVGDYLIKHRIELMKNSKSLEGSGAFFLITLLLVILFVPQPPVLSLIVPILITSLLITLVELVLVGGFDNLLLPIVASYLFKVLIL